MRNKPMSPFTRPINQFLDVINVLSLENQPSAKRRKIIDLIEHQMTSGTIEISDSPNKEIRYVTETENGEQKSLPLRTVSAVVTEISPLILLLKHMENIESLCYEEPEMCLHPQLQHQMGRVMARIVNSGIDVIATTHSDILLQSINNKMDLQYRHLIMHWMISWEKLIWYRGIDHEKVQMTRSTDGLKGNVQMK